MTVWIIGVTGDMLQGVYTPNYPTYFAIAIWATTSITILSIIIRKSKILSWLGINSLAIMLIHEPIKRVVIKVFSIASGVPVDVLRVSIAQSLLITFVVIIILVPLVLFINRYMPFLLGKAKSSSK